jgi:TRAP-type C4-dicarboxylate transport system permease small subunit
MAARVVKWFDEHFEESILVVLLIAICCVMMLQVIMRKVFNNSLSWPEEFCRYCYVWTTFMTLAYTMRHGNIIRVGVLVDLFPPVLRKLFYLFGNVLSLICFAVFFYYSIGVVKGIYFSGQKSTAIGLPMYIVYFATIAGFGFSTLRTVQVVVKNILNFNDKDEVPVNALKEEAKAEIADVQSHLQMSSNKEGR